MALNDNLVYSAAAPQDRLLPLLSVALLCNILLLSAFSFAAEVQNSSGGALPKFAGTLEVVKTAPESVNIGDEFTVRISITNKGSAAVDAYIAEYMANVKAVSPQPTRANISNIDAAQPPVLTWKITLAPGATQSVEYKAKPMAAGPLAIGPTSVFVPGGKFFSNPVTISVACSASPVCDEALGETPFTCPGKCGGSPSAEPLSAPESKIIPTPEYKAPSDPKAVVSEQERKSDEKEKSGLNMVYGGVAAVLLVALAGAYFLFFRPKPKRE